MSSGTGTTDEMIRKYIKEQRPRSEANDKKPPSLLGGSLLLTCALQRDKMVFNFTVRKK